jgi:hypothetical protein
MQIQLPPQDKEFDPITDLITRFKVAYSVFTAKKAIIIIDNQLDVFNTKPVDVMKTCAKISTELYPVVFEEMLQENKIKKLLASA